MGGPAEAAQDLPSTAIADTSRGYYVRVTEVQQIMRDESPFVFLLQGGTQVAYSNDLEGFVYTGSTLGRIDPYTLSRK